MQETPWYDQPDKIFYSFCHTDILDILKQKRIAPETITDSMLHAIKKGAEAGIGHDWDVIISAAIDEAIKED